MGWKRLPIKFIEVGGCFHCHDNKLESLVGAPKQVGVFDCSNNNLISLKGCPKVIDDAFYCHNNKLTSLKGVPADFEGEIFSDFDQD